MLLGSEIDLAAFDLKKVWADHNLSQQERAQSSLEVKQNCEDNRFKW
ncbi:hypothetical protein N644_0299 [Lactiplantibacillus paraplantarum]|uniref:Uncharacterized protein n=1 Tax=Lactiplantibacillus paraplantarum TaxID=60520 RepID=A0ABQ0N8Z4_9LACO|nr:hypothetical protein N644_0299 [Lactiplantibacillus paraplantarum]GBF01476.1 hypothetical protein LPPLD21_00987 [Lactiplantibacillus paraplantarum]GEO60397.1 hypothetical protein LPA07_07180 [Lactiplantibacillus paraplantarum]